MKRRYAVAALGLIAALALTSSALGGPSLNSLIKNEVAKQLSAAHVSKKGKRGPPGPAGPQGSPGAPGTNGADGTARAYAEVSPRGSGGCGVNPAPQPCTFDRAKGISSVTYIGTGFYCVQATGIDARQEVAAVSVDFSETDNPEGNASVQSNTNCNTTGFDVRTERIPVSATPSAAPDDNVAFDIVIP
jgi:hypothetical protein